MIREAKISRDLYLSTSEDVSETFERFVVASRHFELPDSAIGQHPTRWWKEKKRKSLIRLPCPLSSSLPTHAPFFRLTLASFRVLATTLHPTLNILHVLLSRLTYYRFLRYIPSVYPLLLKSKLPSCRFQKFSRSSFFLLPACVSLLARP